MTESAEWFTTRDGTRLALDRQGSPAAPLTVVLAHGWTLDTRSWDPVTDLLVRQGLRVVRYDHRGHGRSDPARPGTATIAQLADDLAELLRGPIAGPVVLAGHSMGGMAIMGLAEHHPDLVADRVAGAVFIATACNDLIPFDLRLPPALARLVAGGESRLMRTASRMRRMRDRDRTARRSGLLRPGVRWLLFGAHPRREDVARTARIMAGCRPATFVDFRPTFDDHDRVAALPAFERVPVLVLGGTLDRLTPVRHSVAIAAELPHATLVRYSGAGHMVPLERAEQVASRIGELASGVSGVSFRHEMEI